MYSRVQKLPIEPVAAPTGIDIKSTVDHKIAHLMN